LANTALQDLAFAAGAVVSLGTSTVLVSRIERVAERLGLSEALLGIVAALAADSPEITSAISAIASHQVLVGAGVVLGSCVFNLAALGLGAVAGGFIPLHRRVIVLGGTISIWVSLAGLGAATHALGPAAALGAAVIVLVAYILVSGTAHAGLTWVPKQGRAWLVSAVTEEEEELSEVIRPEPGSAADGVAAGLALLIVIGASVVMERAASSIGHRLGVSEIVVGALVLAGVTSIPNAVASTYLARKGRGAAALSTTFNSNNFNIVIGLLLPAAIVGLGARSDQSILVAAWCLAMTALAMSVAYRAGGLRRRAGLLLVASYAGFVVAVVAVGSG
jgi:cation:H+ antiporter